MNDYRYPSAWDALTPLAIVAVALTLLVLGAMALRPHANGAVVCKEQIVGGQLYANECVRLKP